MTRLVRLLQRRRLLAAGSVPARRSGRRARLMAAGMATVFAMTASKGVALSLSGGNVERTVGGTPFAADRAVRADIVDRNGELLATTVTVQSLFADPRAIWDPARTAQQLASVLDGIDPEALERRLADRDRAFVWVKRQLTPRQRDAVFALGLEGLGFRNEDRRAYLNGSLAGHLLGYTDIDGKGLGGIEFSEEDRLTGRSDPLQLTLDAGVQFVLETELDRAATAQQAIGAAGIVTAAKTGEILALASWPPLNPNRAQSVAMDDPSRLNRAVTGVYELGSVFKPLTVAAAIDAGAIGAHAQFDTETPLTVDGQVIEDLHPVASPASVQTILSASSNTGTVRIAQALGRSAHWAALERFGLLDRPTGDIPGAAKPIPPAPWTQLTAATVSYGHGIAVSPLALVSAYAALANDGARVPLHLIAGETPGEAVTVVSPNTSETIVAMLREAVVAGTGKAADAPGYRVAGKTGTAEKAIDGVYDPNRNLNSFAAVFPADRPEYAILIVLDEAKPPPGATGLIVGDTAATTAAPLAGRIIDRVAPLLGVMPRLDDAGDQAPDERRHSG